MATDLSKTSLEMLFANQVGMIYVPGFFSQIECDLFVDCFDRTPMGFYESVEPPIGRSGITQFEAEGHDKNWYFDQVESHSEKLRQMCRFSRNPLTEVMNKIQSSCGLEACRAQEPAYGTYFAGLIRQINKRALLHSDYAPFQAKGWSIERAYQQLAWNLYMTDFEGGEVRVYEKAWNFMSDEKYKLQNSYGYDYQLVAGKNYLTIKPEKGDLVLFNSQNFHEVMEARGRRLSAGSFFSKIDDSIQFWS